MINYKHYLYNKNKALQLIEILFYWINENSKNKNIIKNIFKIKKKRT